MYTLAWGRTLYVHSRREAYTLCTLSPNGLWHPRPRMRRPALPSGSFAPDAPADEYACGACVAGACIRMYLCARVVGAAPRAATHLRVARA
jgi:hypothetical protein